MATTVDNKVVSMEFDNQQFESNASQTLSTIDRLKEALQFSNVRDGFVDISNAARNVDLEPINQEVTSVSSTFEGLQRLIDGIYYSLANKLTSAALNFLRTFSLGPIMDGFEEYELKMRSIQTIMANARSKSSQTAQSAANTIEAASETITASAQTSKKEATAALKETQKAETKALTKKNDAELKEYEANAKAELSAVEQSKKEESETKEAAYEEQLKALQDAQKEEQKTLQNSYKQQLKDLEKTQTEELNTLKKAHNEKLSMYEEEYMAKVKSIDEERYNELKAIQEQIDALEELTDAENRATKETAQQQKLAELERANEVARSAKRRQETEQALAEYQKELEQEKVQEERKAQIESLKDQMDVVNDIYDSRVDAAKEEYQTQKELENDQYSEQYDVIREQQQLQRESAQELYQEQLEAMQERYSTEKQALRDQYELEMESLNELIAAQKSAIQDRQAEEKEAIRDRQSEELDALNTRHSKELDDLSETYSTASSNVSSLSNQVLDAIDSTNNELERVTLEQVTSALDNLNEYADKTVYKFSDMTDAIGRFTVAGVPLEDSVEAVKGLSNAAALANTDSTKLAMAQYQLSQALVSGRVLTRDWMSLESANIVGAEFQEMLKDTARVHGVAIDEMIAEEGSLRNTLASGWLTTDIMIETLRKFTGDLTDEELAAMGYNEEQIKSIQEVSGKALEAATKVRTLTQFMDTTREAMGSGWAQTFELIFGDFNQATDMWSNLSDYFGEMIGKQTDARNALLQGWQDAGGRDSIINGIKNLWQNVLTIAELVKATFGKIFSGPTAKSLTDFSKNFEKFTEKIKMNYKTCQRFAGILNGVWGAVDLVKKAIGGVIDVLSPLAPVVGALGGVILDIASGVGNWIYDFDRLIDSSGAFDTFVDFVKGGVKGIADALSDIVSWLQKHFSASQVTSFMTDAYNSVKTAFSPVSQVFTDIIEDIKGFFSNFTVMFDPSKGEFANVVSSVSGVAETIVGVLTGIPGKIAEAAKGVWDAIKSFFGGSAEEFDYGDQEIQKQYQGFVLDIDGIFGAISDFIEGIKKIGSQVVGAIKDFVSGIANEIDVSDIFEGIGIINAGAMTSVMMSISRIFKNLATESKDGQGILAALRDIFKSVSENISKISDALTHNIKNMEKEINIEFIKALAGAIAILTAALFVLSKLDPDALEQALKAVAISVGELIVAMGIFNKLDMSSMFKIDARGITKSTNSIGTTLLEFAFTMLLLAGAMKSLAKEDWGGIVQGLTGMGGLMFFMHEFINTTKLAATEAEGVKIFSLIEFAFAMDLMAAAFRILETDDWAAYLRGAMSFGELAIVLGLVIPRVKAATRAAGPDKSIYSPLIDFGKTVALLAIAFRVLETESWTKFLTGALAFLELSIVLGILIPKLYKLCKQCKNQTYFEPLIEFAAAMDLLALGFAFLGTTDWDTFVAGSRAMLSLALILILAVAAIYAVSKACDGGTLDGILEFAAAMDLLVVGLSFLTKYDLKQIGTGLVGLLGIAAILAAGVGGLAILVQFSKINPKDLIAVGGAVVIFALAMLMLTPALMALSQLSLGEVGTALAAIAGVFVILGGAAKILAPLSDTILKLAGSFALLGIGVAGVGVGLLAFAVGLTALAAAGTGAVATLIFTVEGILQGILDIIINNAGRIGEAVVTVFFAICDTLIECLPKAIETVMQIVLGIIAGIAENAPQIVDQTIQIIIGVLDVITQRIPELVSKIAEFIGALVSAILDEIRKIDPQEAIELISAIVGAISLAIEGFFDVIGNLLEELGKAIGRFVGGIAAGIAEGITSSLPDIGTDLSSFMTNGQAFFDGAAGIKPEVLEGVKTLAEAILALTGANLLDALTSFFTGGKSSLASFGEELALFGPSFKTFYENIQDVKPDVVTATSNAIAALVAIAKDIPGESKWLAKLTGDNSLSSFGDELEDFGPKFWNYYSSIADVKSDVVTATANAVGALVTVAQGVPGQPGWLATLTGDKSLSKFGEELEKFGPHFATYAGSVSGITAAEVEESSKAAESVFKMAKKVPNEGGLAGFLAGENDIGKFGEELEKFGPHLTNYANSVSTISAASVEESTKAGEAVFKMAKKVPREGGWVGWISGDNSIGTFGEELAKFGPSLTAYATSVDSITYSVVTKTGYITKVIESLSEAVPEQGALSWLINGEVNVETFGKSLVGFGESFVDYSDKIQNVDTTKVAPVTEEINHIIEMCKGMMDINLTNVELFGAALTRMATDSLDAFVTAFTGSEERVVNAVNIFVDYAVKAANSVVGSLTDSGTKLGNELIDSFSSGVLNKLDTSRDAIKAMAFDFRSTMDINFKRPDYVAIGEGLLQWIIDGIENKRAKVREEIIDFCDRDVIQLLQSKLKEDTIKPISVSMMNYLDAGIVSTESTVLSRVKKVCENIVAKFKTHLGSDELYPIGTIINNNIALGLTSSMFTLETAVKTVASKLLTAFSLALNEDALKDIGKEVANGIAKGLKENTDTASEAARETAKAVEFATRDYLHINSPSKTFVKLGGYVIEGFANGIQNGFDMLSGVVDGLGNRVVNPIDAAIEKICDSMESVNSDFSPVITPVIDLTNVNSAAGTIASTFGNLKFGTTMNLAQSAYSGFSYGRLAPTETLDTRDKMLSDKLDKLSDTIADNSKTENYNNFYISSTDPKKAAEEVGYIMQHKVERRRAVWAK